MAFFIVFYNTANVRNLYLTVNRYQVDTLWFLLCDCGNRIILKEGRRDFAIVTRKKCDNWWKTQEIQTLRKAGNSVLYFRQPGLMKEDSIRIFSATRLRNLISSWRSFSKTDVWDYEPSLELSMVANLRYQLSWLYKSTWLKVWSRSSFQMKKEKRRGRGWKSSLKQALVHKRFHFKIQYFNSISEWWSCKVTRMSK